MTERSGGMAIGSTSLLGCPFCGGEARYGENSDEGLEWIECGKCGACTTAMAPLMQGVEGLLAEAWNQRQPNDQAHASPEAERKGIA